MSVLKSPFVIVNQCLRLCIKRAYLEFVLKYKWDLALIYNPVSLRLFDAIQKTQSWWYSSNSIIAGIGCCYNAIIWRFWSLRLRFSIFCDSGEENISSLRTHFSRFFGTISHPPTPALHFSFCSHYVPEVLLKSSLAYVIVVQAETTSSNS